MWYIYLPDILWGFGLKIMMGKYKHNIIPVKIHGGSGAFFKLKITRGNLIDLTIYVKLYSCFILFYCFKQFYSILSYQTNFINIPMVFQSLSHVRLCDPMDCSTLGFPVFHYLLEFAQSHVH